MQDVGIENGPVDKADPEQERGAAQDQRRSRGGKCQPDSGRRDEEGRGTAFQSTGHDRGKSAPTDTPVTIRKSTGTMPQ